MPTDITSSFNTEMFNEWKTGEDRLEYPWSDQITLRCLSVFDTKINAMNKSVSRREAWNRKYDFTLQNLFELEKDKAYIVTPCGLNLQEKTTLLDMMSGSKAWFFLIEALRTMNDMLATISQTYLKIPKECFVTRVITLEAKDGKHYLLREQRYEVRTYGSKHLDAYDRWYDVDLNRFEP